MAGGEDQTQQVVAEFVVERLLDLGDRIGLLVEVAADFLVLALQHLGAAEAVESAMLGGLHQPGAGIARHALVRPLLERGDERVLRQFLGPADIAGDAG